MPHVLYNHMTHSWDTPDPDDGASDAIHSCDESPHFGPFARRALPGLALGAGTAITALILLGLIAGVLFGVS